MPVDAVCNDWRCTALVSFPDDFLHAGGGGGGGLRLVICLGYGTLECWHIVFNL